MPDPMNPAERMKWLFQNLPSPGMSSSGKPAFHDDLALMLFGLGGVNGFGRNNFNQLFWDQAIARGQNPMETLPWLNGSWGSGSGGSGSGSGSGSGNGSGGSGSGSGSGSGNLPQWWRDWYDASGQYGGVPPGGGLLG